MTLIKHGNPMNLDTLLDSFVDNLFNRDIAPYTVNPIKNNFPNYLMESQMFTVITQILHSTGLIKKH